MTTFLAASANTALNFWPPKYSTVSPLVLTMVVWLRNLSFFMDSRSAGKPPWSTLDMTASLLWSAYAMNLYAASAFLDEERIARELPPLSETSCPPADHAGIWAMRHLPAPSDAWLRNMPGAHAAVITPANSPEPTARYQSSLVPLVFVSMRSSSIIFCQSLVNFLTPGSPVRFTVTVLPSLDVE